MPARTMLRMAVRRKSCGRLPGQALRDKRTDIARGDRRHPLVAEKRRQVLLRKLHLRCAAACRTRTHRSTSYGPIASSAVMRSYRKMTTSVGRWPLVGTYAAGRVTVAIGLTVASAADDGFRKSSSEVHAQLQQPRQRCRSIFAAEHAPIGRPAVRDVHAAQQGHGVVERVCHCGCDNPGPISWVVQPLP